MWAEAQNMDGILNQLPNGGAVVAVVTVVYVFLRHLEKTNEVLRGIVATFTSETTAARAEYRDHVSAIMEQGLGAHRETREAIRSLDATLAGLRRPATTPTHHDDPGH